MKTRKRRSFAFEKRGEREWGSLNSNKRNKLGITREVGEVSVFREKRKREGGSMGMPPRGGKRGIN